MNGWTGGQYSLYRGLLGGLLAAGCAAELLEDPGGAPRVPLAAGVLAGAALAAGWRDRSAALVLLGAGAWLWWAGRAPAAAPFVGWLLLVHLGLPRAPYGSLAARGRADPDGGWRLPEMWIAATWIVLLAGYGVAGYQRLLGPGDFALAWSVLALVLACALLAWLRPMRPWLWLALLAAHAALALASGGRDPASGVLVLSALTFDPAWWPPAGERGRVFYDGGCGLCHRAVRFVLAEDRVARFRFAPLESASFAAAVPESERAELPDSLVVVLDSGARAVRSDALLAIGRGLGGVWRGLAACARLVPRRVRDAAYDAVARVRLRLFARPPEACPLVPQSLRRRFES